MRFYNYRHQFIFLSLIVFMAIHPVITHTHSTVLYGVPGLYQEEEKEKAKEEKSWKKKLDAYFNINQYSFSNWSKGGINSLSWSLRLLADVKYKGKQWIWEFTHLMEFGQIKEGIESKTTFDMQVMKNLNIRSTLNMFTSFQHPEEVDINWDSLFISKLNSFITCSFNIQLIYDKDVIDKAQIREEPGIGVIFNLG
ncbi:MAG: DUF3078 domain-containing protein [bacterium]